MDVTLKDRLTAYLKYKGVNNSEFGRIVGVSNAYISSIRKSIQPDKVSKIAEKFPDLNMNWLLTGDGDMLRPVVTQQVGDIDGDAQNVNVYNSDYNTLLKIVEAHQRTSDSFIEVVKKSQEQTDNLIAMLKMVLEKK